MNTCDGHKFIHLIGQDTTRMIKRTVLNTLATSPPRESTPDSGYGGGSQPRPDDQRYPTRPMERRKRRWDGAEPEVVRLEVSSEEDETGRPPAGSRAARRHIAAEANKKCPICRSSLKKDSDHYRRQHPKFVFTYSDPLEAEPPRSFVDVQSALLHLMSSLAGVMRPDRAAEEALSRMRYPADDHRFGRHCVDCGETMFREEQHDGHRARCASNKQDLICRWCDRLFEDRDEALRHSNRHRENSKCIVTRETLQLVLDVHREQRDATRAATRTNDSPSTSREGFVTPPPTLPMPSPPPRRTAPVMPVPPPPPLPPIASGLLPPSAFFATSPSQERITKDRVDAYRNFREASPPAAGGSSGSFDAYSILGDHSTNGSSTITDTLVFNALLATAPPPDSPIVETVRGPLANRQASATSVSGPNEEEEDIMIIGEQKGNGFGRTGKRRQTAKGRPRVSSSSTVPKDIPTSPQPSTSAAKNPLDPRLSKEYRPGSATEAQTRYHKWVDPRRHPAPRGGPNRRCGLVPSTAPKTLKVIPLDLVKLETYSDDNPNLCTLEENRRFLKQEDGSPAMVMPF